jgi:hypothetical protein
MPTPLEKYAPEQASRRSGQVVPCALSSETRQKKLPLLHLLSLGNQEFSRTHSRKQDSSRPGQPRDSLPLCFGYPDAGVARSHANCTDRFGSGCESAKIWHGFASKRVFGLFPMHSIASSFPFQVSYK